MSPMLIALANATAAATTLERLGGTVTDVHAEWVFDAASDVEYADWQVLGTAAGNPIEIGPTFASPGAMVVDWDGDEYEVDDLTELECLLSGDDAQ